MLPAAPPDLCICRTRGSPETTPASHATVPPLRKLLLSLAGQGGAGFGPWLLVSGVALGGMGHEWCLRGDVGVPPEDRGPGSDGRAPHGHGPGLYTELAQSAFSRETVRCVFEEFPVRGWLTRCGDGRIWTRSAGWGLRRALTPNSFSRESQCVRVRSVSGRIRRIHGVTEGRPRVDASRADLDAWLVCGSDIASEPRGSPSGCRECPEPCPGGSGSGLLGGPPGHPRATRFSMVRVVRLFHVSQQIRRARAGPVACRCWFRCDPPACERTYGWGFN